MPSPTGNRHFIDLSIFFFEQIQSCQFTLHPTSLAPPNDNERDTPHCEHSEERQNSAERRTIKYGLGGDTSGNPRVGVQFEGISGEASALISKLVDSLRVKS
jgi:hypothetical protein